MEWTTIDTKIKGYGKSIIYANEKYYLCYFDKNGVASSDDLINWETLQLDNEKIGATEDIAYGNGKFIITGNSGNNNKTYIYVSNDGTNWNLKELNTGQNFSMNINTCKFLNNRFVFTTGYHYSKTVNGIKVITSSVHQFYETVDGNTIIRHDYEYVGSKNVSIMDIAYGNNLYVQVGSTGSIFTSSDLINWKEQKSGVEDKLVGISFGKGLFVVTGENGIILTSIDGKEWKKQTSNTTSYLIRSHYGNGVYVATGYNGTILTSTNGIDWIDEDDEFVRTIMYGLTFANNKFVITAGRRGSTGTVQITVAEVSRKLTYSSDNSLYIFDKDLNFLGVIDEFISLRWRRRYYEAGEFDLTVATYENNKRLLKKGNIVIRQNYTEAAIIDTREKNDDGTNYELKVSGRFLSYLTHRRILHKRVIYSGNAIDGQKKLLNNMTPLTTKFEIEPTSFASDNIKFQSTYKRIYDQLVNISRNSNIGFRIVPNIENKTYIFENFKGVDRSKNQSKNDRYCFSKENGNLLKETIIDTDINKCNYVLIGGIGEDENRILTSASLGDFSGFDLFEEFVDAKNESNNNMSQDEYINLLQEKGKEKLSDEPITISFTGNAKDYRFKWDLGDIVDVDLEDVEDKYRITEVEETIENNIQNIYPTFGPPLAEKINFE